MMTLATTILIARFTVLTPRDGMQAAFESGYKRHLEWHRAHEDPWTWHGWTIITGDRIGTFVDATVDRTPAEIDAPVSPAEDQADFGYTIAPYARLISSAFYRARPDLCRKRTLPFESAFSSMATIRVEPADRKAFETALAAKDVDGTCFELMSGGEAVTYLLLRPAKSLAAAITLGDDLAGMRIRQLTLEVLRYRPDLTYVAAAR